MKIEKLRSYETKKYHLINGISDGILRLRRLFEPAVENFKQPSDLENMPSWAVGLLGHAYIGNPLGENANNWSFTEVATDDAVSNDVNNGYRKMAAGAGVRTILGDLNRWQNLRASWQYLNQFLEISEKCGMGQRS